MFKTFTCHVVTAFSLRLTRCQINDAKPGRTLAYREQRPSRAKHTEWTHVVSTAPPPKGWGRIQRIYLAWENRRTDPKWTACKKSEVIRKFGPWMDFWMLKGIRKIPVQKTWTKYVVDRDWFRIRDGTPGPRECTDLRVLGTTSQKGKCFFPLFVWPWWKQLGWLSQSNLLV